METRLIVKADLRRGLAGPLQAKALETPAVSGRRLHKAADPEDIKELRVWELREVLPNALAADPRAALDLVSDLLGLRAAGVIVALAPRAAAGAHDLVVETAEAVVAAADVQAAALRATEDGVVDAEEATDLERRERHAERELAQVRVLAQQYQAPQGRIAGVEVAP